MQEHNKPLPPICSWLVKTRRAPSRHSRDARVYDPAVSGGRVSAPLGSPSAAPGRGLGRATSQTSAWAMGSQRIPAVMNVYQTIPPTPGSHPSHTRSGRLRTIMKVALLPIHFRPMTFLYKVVFSHRSHARQLFVITEDTVVVTTRRHIRLNSARTLLIMLAGASTPTLVSSGTAAPPTAAGKNAYCATAAATKQEDPEPALSSAAATGQAGYTIRDSHTTPTLVTSRKRRVPHFHSRSLTAATVETPNA